MNSARSSDLFTVERRAHQPIPSSVRLPLLDGVRGLAVAAVLLCHEAVQFISAKSFLEYGVLKTLTPLWVGVNVFFVLSGFLITGILIDNKGRDRFFVSFYGRRLLRIFPLYFATLAVVFVLGPALKELPPTKVTDQFWYWSYLYNWRAIYGYAAFRMGHLWSLAVEEQFYMLWPVLIYFTPKRNIKSLCCVMIALSFLFRITIPALSLSGRWDYFATPARVEDLCMGALVACIIRDEACLRRWTACTGPLSGLFATVTILAALIGKGFESNKLPAVSFGVTGINGLTAVLLLTISSGTKSRSLTAVFGNFPARWLGKYSYGIYLLHPFVIGYLADLVLMSPKNSTIERLGSASGFMAATIGLSLMLAFLSYHLFESRFLRLKRYF